MPAGQWRVLPLTTEGKVDPAWAQVGWGGFVVDDSALWTECDERGMGMLLYKPEKFGDCQIRVVYRCEKLKSNAGLFVRIDDGVLAKAVPVPEKPQAQWRTMVITLDGERITVDVDGKRLSSFDAAAPDNPPRKLWTEPIRELKRPTHGYVGLQNHDPGDVVWFKEVSVRPLNRDK